MNFLHILLFAPQQCCFPYVFPPHHDMFQNYLSYTCLSYSHAFKQCFPQLLKSGLHQSESMISCVHSVVTYSDIKAEKGFSSLKVSSLWTFVSLVCCEFKVDFFNVWELHICIYFDQPIFIPSLFFIFYPLEPLFLPNFMCSLLNSIKPGQCCLQVHGCRVIFWSISIF